MKKIALVFLLIIIAAAGTYVFHTRLSPSARFRQGEKAEADADYNKALSQYIKDLRAIAQAYTYPDKRKMVFGSKESWRSEIATYYQWVHSSVPSKNPAYHSILQSIVRCTSYTTKELLLYVKKPQQLTRERVRREYRTVFSGKNTDIGTLLNGLADKSIADSMSMIQFQVFAAYTYRGALLNISTGRYTLFTLYPEEPLTLLVSPGNHFIICQSERIFTEGIQSMTWRSRENILPLVVPTKPQLLQATIETKIR